jgi:hypothetical protein
VLLVPVLALVLVLVLTPTSSTINAHPGSH